MRKKIVAGNWKMNLMNKEAILLFNTISTQLDKDSIAKVMVFPPSLYVHQLATERESIIAVGVQNFYPKDKGAFTGEISISQVKDSGAKSVLIGHSERRAYFNETNDFLKEKVNAALAYELDIIFCCGEPLEIRENNSEMSFVKKQLEESLFHLDGDSLKKCIIAYEPVWAIGTGKTATIAQAEEMHAAIRSWLTERYDADIADSISLLYGGSCNASNAKELFSCPNVDGGLIGGAALDAEAFLQITNSF
jgi:triosephosphate isomerase